MVMSGSGGVKVVDASPWTPKDLDFYCPVDNARQALDWFNKMGYSVADQSKEYVSLSGLNETVYEEQGVEVHLGARNCIKAVFTMAHPNFSKTINLIQSSSSSALAPIVFFHSTLVMNYVSADGVACAYPSLTLNGTGACVTHYY